MIGPPSNYTLTKLSNNETQGSTEGSPQQAAFVEKGLNSSRTLGEAETGMVVKTAGELNDIPLEAPLKHQQVTRNSPNDITVRFELTGKLTIALSLRTHSPMQCTSNSADVEMERFHYDTPTKMKSLRGKK